MIFVRGHQKTHSPFSFSLCNNSHINRNNTSPTDTHPPLPLSLHPPADLKNEPHGLATWGTGDEATDWNTAAEKIGAHLLGKQMNKKTEGAGLKGLFSLFIFQMCLCLLPPSLPQNESGAGEILHHFCVIPSFPPFPP